MRTQLALHIRFTEYKGIYNVRTGFVGKHGELTAKMRGSPHMCQIVIIAFSASTNLKQLIFESEKTSNLIHAN